MMRRPSDGRVCSFATSEHREHGVCFRSADVQSYANRAAFGSDPDLMRHAHLADREKRFEHHQSPFDAPGSLEYVSRELACRELMMWCRDFSDAEAFASWSRVFDSGTISNDAVPSFADANDKIRAESKLLCGVASAALTPAPVVAPALALAPPMPAPAPAVPAPAPVLALAPVPLPVPATTESMRICAECSRRLRKPNYSKSQWKRSGQMARCNEWVGCQGRHSHAQAKTQAQTPAKLDSDTHSDTYDKRKEEQVVHHHSRCRDCILGSRGGKPKAIGSRAASAVALGFVVDTEIGTGTGTEAEHAQRAQARKRNTNTNRKRNKSSDSSSNNRTHDDENNNWGSNGNDNGSGSDSVASISISKSLPISWSGSQYRPANWGYTS